MPKALIDQATNSDPFSLLPQGGKRSKEREEEEMYIQMYIPRFSVPEAPGGTKDEMQKAEDLAHARML